MGTEAQTVAFEAVACGADRSYCPRSGAVSPLDSGLPAHVRMCKLRVLLYLDSFPCLCSCVVV